MYQINPIDSFFFRSAVPFESAGETSLVGGMFPPFPSAYAGALKGFATTKRIRIGFNGIAIGDEFCFPKPLDLIPFEKEAKTFCRNMALEKTPLSSFPLPYYLCDRSEDDSKAKASDDLYIDCRYLQMYLCGVVIDFACFPLSKYIANEPKIGIAIDNASNTAKDKYLYQIQMLRPKCGMKLVADVKNVSIEGEALIKLGGESKMARISQFPDLSVGSSPIDSAFFKLYFATPAIFKNGWLPAWIDPVEKTGRFSYKDKSVKVQLITAAVGRKEPVGGFGYDIEFTDSIKKDKKRKYKPREMRYAVPAGSVYYFKLIEGSFQNALSLFNQKCISDYREDYGFEYPPLQYNRIKYCDRGFGYAIVGALNKEQEEMLKCMM